MDTDLCALEQIMLEEDDLDLFSDDVVQAYRSLEAGPLVAHAKLKRETSREKDPKRKKRQEFWLHPKLMIQISKTRNGFASVNGCLETSDLCVFALN